jgi:hypothetical protein
MLSQLYFPDSQKLTVYLPMVLPPILTALMALVNEFRTAKRKNAAQQKQNK